MKIKLGRRFPLPFYLPDKRVFVPFKMRKPKLAGDKTYGYVDLSSIKSVSTIDSEVFLNILLDERIAVFNNPEVIRNIINLGREIEYQINRSPETEPEMVYAAMKILIDKLFKIEGLLSDQSLTIS